jgi:hypothetical protein
MNNKIPVAKVRSRFIYREGLLIYKTGRYFMESAGTLRHDGRNQIMVDKIFYLRSRLIWAYHNGDPAHMTVDHIDRDRANDRIDNLRLATQAEQNKNLGANSRNTSGVNGVFWNERDGKWVAYICPNGSRNKHLGYFDSFEDAVAVRRKANIYYGFDPTHGASNGS